MRFERAPCGLRRCSALSLPTDCFPLIPERVNLRNSACNQSAFPSSPIAHKERGVSFASHQADWASLSAHAARYITVRGALALCCGAQSDVCNIEMPLLHCASRAFPQFINLDLEPPTVITYTHGAGIGSADLYI
jgi:hypothetical protein